jgi:hypothetical protein
MAKKLYSMGILGVASLIFLGMSVLFFLINIIIGQRYDIEEETYYSYSFIFECFFLGLLISLILYLIDRFINSK